MIHFTVLIVLAVAISVIAPLHSTKPLHRIISWTITLYDLKPSVFLEVHHLPGLFDSLGNHPHLPNRLWSWWWGRTSSLYFLNPDGSYSKFSLGSRSGSQRHSLPRALRKTSGGTTRPVLVPGCQIRQCTDCHHYRAWSQYTVLFCSQCIQWARRPLLEWSVNRHSSLSNL